MPPSRATVPNLIGLDEDGGTPGVLAPVKRGYVSGLTLGIADGLSTAPSRNTDRYARRMAQMVTRVEEDLVAAVDELVAAGIVASRSEAVRRGLEQLVDRHRRETIGARISDGYRARPQSEAEVAWADESSQRMIAEEPW